MTKEVCISYWVGKDGSATKEKHYKHFNLDTSMNLNDIKEMIVENLQAAAQERDDLTVNVIDGKIQVTHYGVKALPMYCGAVSDDYIVWISDIKIEEVA